MQLQRVSNVISKIEVKFVPTLALTKKRTFSAVPQFKSQDDVFVCVQVYRNTHTHTQKHHVSVSEVFILEASSFIAWPLTRRMKN